MAQENTQGLPHWQLTSVYPGLDSAEYKAAKAELAAGVRELEQRMDAWGVSAGARPEVTAEVAARFDELITRTNEVLGLVYTVYPYLLGFVSTDAFNDQAQAELSSLAPLRANLEFLTVRLTGWVGSLPREALLEASELARAHRYVVERSAEKARHLMPEEAEALLAALAPSGGHAWAKLHADLISRSTLRKALPGREDAEYPLTALRTFQSDADPELRRAAFEAELELLEQNAVSFAAALNSIKAQVGDVAQRRGYASALDETLFLGAITRKSLDAMQEACRAAFPVFRRYLKAKARFLGKDALAWYDLRAPVSAAPAKRYSWEEAAAFIVQTFGSYSDKLAAFAQKTFDEGWHDVPPRKGKRNGAFCMRVYGVKESRVMHNFGAGLDDVLTIAHELGHAYHNACMFEAGRTPLQSDSPMTLAETASIFCETVALNAMLAKADDAEKLAILEQDLLSSTQLVIDIDSRFRFEQGVFDKRRERELSLSEFNALMLEAQAETYGDALAANARHPLMWAHKGHYYSTGRSYYNFPYTFGYLFGLGLYAQYEAQPEGWHARYDRLLSETGMHDATSLAAPFGIDLESPAFWQRSLAVAAQRVAAYEELVEQLERDRDYSFEVGV